MICLFEAKVYFVTFKLLLAMNSKLQAASRQKSVEPKCVGIYVRFDTCEVPGLQNLIEAE